MFKFEKNDPKIYTTHNIVCCTHTITTRNKSEKTFRYIDKAEDITCIRILNIEVEYIN